MQRGPMPHDSVAQEYVSAKLHASRGVLVPKGETWYMLWSQDSDSQLVIRMLTRRSRLSSTRVNVAPKVVAVTQQLRRRT